MQSSGLDKKKNCKQMSQAVSSAFELARVLFGTWVFSSNEGSGKTVIVGWGLQSTRGQHVKFCAPGCGKGNILLNVYP